MAEFVRICPRCGKANPEYESLCSGCDQFIGMEAAVPAPAEAAASEAEPAPAQAAPPPAAVEPTPPPVAEVPPAQATRRYVPVAESFYLQVPDTDLSFTVRPGDVLGQAHATSDAALQVPDSVTGATFLHRRHCRFERDFDGWRVVAIDQQAFGSEFTNPTLVNQHRLAPGDRRPLADGDQLRLSGVGFVVRMP